MRSRSTKPKLPPLPVGARFGLWVVSGPPVYVKYEDSRVPCTCDCGKSKLVMRYTLVNGDSTNCGCRRLRHAIAARRNPEAPMNRKWEQYRTTASRKGNLWKLTRPEFDRLITGLCHYCGEAGGGIDRVNNAEGYHTANSVSCCRLCNQAKSNLSMAEFKDLVSKIFHHFANESPL